MKAGLSDSWTVGRVLGLVVLLSAGPAIRLSALQCPDGSPPPCRVAALPPVSLRTDSNAVAILPFRVAGTSADVDWLREGMVDLLSTSLDGLGGWRVVHPRTLLARAPRAGDVGEVDRARLLARVAGAASVVVGSAVAVGPQLRLNAELYDVRLGFRLAAVEARGSIDDPGPIADSLAVGLARQRLVDHPGSARRLVNEYATASPQALRAYLAAERLARRGAWQAAADSLIRALAIDSTFGLAYYRLYLAATFGATVPGRTYLSILAPAVRHADRLPPRQQGLVLAAFALHQGLRAEALQRADELGRRYPDDADVAFAEGESYFHIGLELGEPASRALAAFERAIRLDPGALDPYNHAIELLCLTGDTARAWSLLDRALAVDPGFLIGRALELAMRVGLRGEAPTPVARELLPLASGGDPLLLRAQSEALRVLDDHPTRAIAAADTIAALAVSTDRPRSERLAAVLRRSAYRHTEGRYLDGWKYLEEASAMDGASSSVLAYRAMFALMTGGHREEGRVAARRLAAAADSASARLGRLLVASGAAEDQHTAALAAALHLLDSLGTEDYAGGVNRAYTEAHRAGLLGLRDLRRGDSAEARGRLELAVRVRPYQSVSAALQTAVFVNNALDVRFSLELARLERAAGALEAASRRLFDAIMWQGGVPYRAEFEELRAQIAEQQGDTATAIRAYRNFIELWKDADPELQPRVEAAQAALARLEVR